MPPSASTVQIRDRTLDPNTSTPGLLGQTGPDGKAAVTIPSYEPWINRDQRLEILQGGQVRGYSQGSLDPITRQEKITLPENCDPDSYKLDEPVAIASATNRMAPAMPWQDFFTMTDA